ncbi:MAG: carbohydrate-binding domain-containing protein [Clostridia bacterium]|nr:carbohydrate-binding domain-containing protein [Clostridia bacterium]
MKRICMLLLMMTLLTGCTVHADSSEYDLTFTDRELSGTWEEKSAMTITGQGTTCDISGKGAKLSGTTLTIFDEGTYLLRGTFTDMLIVVSAGDKDKVQIVLDSAVIQSDNGPAIYIENADKVFLTLPEGTESLLSDGTEYSVTDGDTTLDAAIFSRADLCINGKGTLAVQGNYKHGIVSKDDLIIANATLNVTAASTALDGKDCVMLSGVTATLNAGSNGVRSDNAEDAARGYVYILDSTLTITAGSDGVQAETLLRSDNAVMTITTGEGSGEPQTNSDWNRRGGWGGFDMSSTAAASEGSWKALKSGKALELNGGAYVIDSQDDCIHTNGDLTITDGLFTLQSGDDGIHADNELLISGGNFTISKSYEGIEASKLHISGGRIDITASDDGLNAAGGADGSATAERWGRGMFSNMVGEIVISGGYIHINASGDGIDSNNTILVSGGVTLVSGSANSANAAFDYDGEATVTGGILVAAGGSGMAQSFTAAENQGCMLFGINGARGGVNLAIVDAQNNIVAAYTPENSYSAVVVTAPGLQVGNTYSVVIDAAIDGADEHGFAANTTYTGGTNIGAIEMTTLLQGGSGHSMGGGPGGGGFGGGPGGGRRPGW